MKHAAAFTLIELLVVIAILGGLSALLLPNFMEARIKARDTQRKNDIKQIQKALELYRQDQATSMYPGPTNPGPNGYFPPPGYSVGGSWTGGGNTYLQTIPGDPSTGAGYFYSTPTNIQYYLCACLENSADPDGQPTSSCPGLGSSACTSGKTYYVTQP